MLDLIIDTGLPYTDNAKAYIHRLAGGEACQVIRKTEYVVRVQERWLDYRNQSYNFDSPAAGYAILLQSWGGVAAQHQRELFNEVSDNGLRAAVSFICLTTAHVYYLLMRMQLVHICAEDSARGLVGAEVMGTLAAYDPTVKHVVDGWWSHGLIWNELLSRNIRVFKCVATAVAKKYRYNKERSQQFMPPQNAKAAYLEAVNYSRALVTGTVDAIPQLANLLHSSVILDRIIEIIATAMRAVSGEEEGRETAMNAVQKVSEV